MLIYDLFIQHVHNYVACQHNYQPIDIISLNVHIPISHVNIIMLHVDTCNLS